VSRVLEDPVYVDICPPGLQLPGGPRWKRIQRVRHEDPFPAPGERLPPGAERLPHERTVYVTLGTVVNKQPGVFEAILGALAGIDVNAIVTVGPDVDPERLGPQPPHVLVERYIPQALVLPRCDALVAHAGAGTMLGALAQGVPQLLLPHGAEQHLNAEACRSAGAALLLAPEEIDAEAVRAGLERVLGESGFAAAARRLRDEIAAMPPADEALAALSAAP
jgi:MGT family glycosyltransferase